MKLPPNLTRNLLTHMYLHTLNPNLHTLNPNLHTPSLNLLTHNPNRLMNRLVTLHPSRHLNKDIRSLMLLLNMSKLTRSRLNPKLMINPIRNLKGTVVTRSTLMRLGRSNTVTTTTTINTQLHLMDPIHMQVLAKRQLLPSTLRLKVTSQKELIRSTNSQNNLTSEQG